jgi:hypothetical protein
MANETMYTMSYVRSYAIAFAVEYDEVFEELLNKGKEPSAARSKAYKAAHIRAKSIADATEGVVINLIE